MKVLIVDDYPGAAEASRVLLEILGHECRAVMNGQAAIEHFSAFIPDIVLLDIGLPDLSGYDVAREMRKRETDGKRAFITALTGWGTADDRVKSLAAGIDMHLLKPPTVDAFQRMLSAADAIRVKSLGSVT